jgi:hypothetical protein
MKMSDDEGGENEFPRDHPFKGRFHVTPVLMENMQDKLMTAVPTWQRVSLEGLSVDELHALFERMRSAFPSEDDTKRVSLPISWDWTDPGPAFQSPIFGDTIIEANKRQKHESEDFL